MYQSKSKLRLQLEARMELLVNQCCDVNDFCCDAAVGRPHLNFLSHPATAEIVPSYGSANDVYQHT